MRPYREQSLSDRPLAVQVPAAAALPGDAVSGTLQSTIEVLLAGSCDSYGARTAIQFLGYPGARSGRIDVRWYIVDRILSRQLAGREGRRLLFRVHDLVQRSIVSYEPRESLSIIGWEVSDRRDLLKCAG